MFTYRPCPNLKLKEWGGQEPAGRTRSNQQNTSDSSTRFVGFLETWVFTDDVEHGWNFKQAFNTKVVGAFWVHYETLKPGFPGFREYRQVKLNAESEGRLV